MPRTVLFTDGSIERRGELRSDDAALTRLMQSDASRFLQIRAGRVRVVPGMPTRLAWDGWDAARALREDGTEIAFLGVLDEQPRFAIIPLEKPQTIENRPREVVAEEDFVGLFQAAASLTPGEAQLAAQAVHLANWSNRARRCGRCGSAMHGVDGGHRRLCSNPTCAWQEFPRTDPVVLALVTRGDRCLLARQPRFPPGFYSALAGFVEPAETIEDAVRREVKEEVGLTVDTVTYIGSQPWPFPGSLMFGFIATAIDDEIVVDRSELEDAFWLDRAEVEKLCRGESLDGRAITLPPVGVVGRQVVDRWIFGPAA